MKALEAFISSAEARQDLAEWRRGRAIWRYIHGDRVVVIAQDYQVGRTTVTAWLKWYDTLGADGLRTGKPPGAAPRLTQAQRDELAGIVENGPIAAGFSSGVWTAAMIGEIIAQRFGVRYHKHHIPKLLNAMGFSVQRPRKRLAKADQAAQADWLQSRLPAIKKKRLPAAG